MADYIGNYTGEEIDEAIAKVATNTSDIADLADEVDGLQAEITAQNPLNADLVNDTNSTHKFVTAAEKQTWNSKQDALTFDNAPTQGSTNPVTSGGIYNVIGDINTVLEEVL